MIGVILWSDAADQKAVIWCEDQGDLAFLSGHENVVLPDSFFEVGDVVEFDVRTERNMRLVSNPKRVEQSWGTSLHDGLSAVRAHTCDAVSDSATVIPFRIEHTPHALSRPIRHEKRHG